MNPFQLPVIVGVSQLRHNRERVAASALEPRELLLAALQGAARDAGPGRDWLRTADGLDIVNVISWRYEDLPGQVAARLGASPAHRLHSEMGGHRPVELVDEAARRIASGESRIALVCGAEAGSSLELALREPSHLGWSRTPGGPLGFDDAMHGGAVVRRHGLVDPIRAYPLFENRLRFELGQRLEEAQRESAELFSDFTRVAATNPAAWNPTVLSPEDISTVTPDNRMICFPYPLRMNAHPRVDQAAAVILTSLGRALEAGLSESRLVHVWGGAGAVDSRELLERVSYGHSPAMRAALDTTLARAEVTADQLEVLDLYSCFPVVPKLARRHLGLSRERRVTTAGGLNAFGGPGNNYSLHALVSLVQRLREGARLGLVYGNGEYLTKHHAVLLGARAHPRGYVGHEGPVTPAERVGPPIVERGEGRAVIETFTVEYDRAGHPLKGFILGRFEDGSRVLANTVEGDGATLAALVDPATEAVGRTGLVLPHADGRNLFRMSS